MIGWEILAQSVTINPLLQTDTRFQPVGVYHNGCTQQFEIFVNTESFNTNLVTVKLSYPSSQLKNLDIKKSEGFDSEISKVISSGLISYTLNTARPFKGVRKFATVSFESTTGTKEAVIRLLEGSILLNSKNSKPVNMVLDPVVLKFASVPSCMQDNDAPFLKLIEPSNVSKPISVNTEFIFSVQDTWRWVDWNDVSVTIDGYKYTSQTIWFQRSGDILSIKPLRSLPFNTGLIMSMRASDLQIYGGKNSVQKQFAFKTPPEPQVCAELGCNMGQNYCKDTVSIVSQKEKICELLSDMVDYVQWSGYLYLSKQWALWGCNVWILSWFDVKKDISSHPSAPSIVQKTHEFTVFSFLGWILFVITLVLKLTYFTKYHSLKHSLK